jgi:Flp pilus assembly protein TadG
MLVRTPRSKLGQEGQALVEFVISAIIFFMVIFGIMNFAFMIYNYHYVDYAARAATRYAIVHGSTSPAPATAADVQSYVTNTVGLTATTTTSWTPNNAPGSTVQVKVDYDFKPLTPLVPQAVLKLTSTSRMVISY